MTKLIAFALAMFAVSAFAANTATITFSAPTTRTDGSSISGALTYEVYQGLKGAAKVKVATISSTTSTISTGLVSGNEYCWDVVAVEAANPAPSAHSAEACKAFALAPPNTVTITVN